ncbi:putative ATPase [Aquamicrobium terrae]
MDAERFFVITGGPGSGKSTLIDMLRARDFSTAPEAGRGIIRAQRDVDGPALPWRDPALFAELMLSWEMRSHAAAREAPGPVFFDRGVPDTVGYLRLVGLPVPPHVMRAAETVRYNRRVFLAPFWPQIFRQDAERRQTAQEAERTCAVMADVYAELGYEPVPLPRVPAEERLRFILSGAGL